MAGEFEGKVVVVTGGSRGIGRAIAAAFAREGAQTVLAASNAGNLADAAEAVAAAGGPAPMTVAGDLRTLAGCEALFAKVTERFQRCDVLANCAGATRGGKFLEQADDLWIDGFALKFFAAVRLTRLFWPLLKTAHGSVVNIVGGAARTPGPGVFDRRFGQRRHGQFHQGPGRARQPRRRQYQRHPSRPDPDRPSRAIVRAICQGAEQDGRRGARAGAGEKRTAPYRQARGCSGARIVFVRRNGRATSRAPPSPSMAAPRRGITSRSSVRPRASGTGTKPAPRACLNSRLGGNEWKMYQPTIVFTISTARRSSVIDASNVRKAAWAVRVTFGSCASG